MRSLVIVALLAGSMDTGWAGNVTAPPGWTADPDAAQQLDRGGDHFGGLATQATFEVWHPATAGAVLYVTRAQGAAKPEQRDAAATAELAELQAELLRHGGDAKIEAQAQTADPDKKQAEGVLRWRDPAMGLVVSSRVVVVADVQRVVAVRGECMLAADAPAELVKACEGALATLDPGVAAGERQAIAIGAAAPAPVAAPSTSSATPPATLDDGSKAVLPPMAVAPKQRETDKRPIYFGGGLIVLAAAFWWNRRRRERFERDEKPEGQPDVDSDDLHEAAEAEKDKRDDG